MDGINTQTITFLGQIKSTIAVENNNQNKDAKLEGYASSEQRHLDDIKENSHSASLLAREKVLVRASFSRLLHHAPQTRLEIFLNASNQSEAPLEAFINFIKEWEWALSYFKNNEIEAIVSYLNYKKERLGGVEKQLAFLKKIIDGQFQSTLAKNLANSELFRDIYTSEYSLNAKNWNSKEQVDILRGKTGYCKCSLAFWRIKSMPRMINETSMINHLIGVSEDLTAPRRFAIIGSGELGDVKEMISELARSGCTNLIVDLVDPGYAKDRLVHACNDFQLLLIKEGFNISNYFVDIGAFKVDDFIRKQQNTLTYRGDYGGANPALRISLNWFACDDISYYGCVQDMQQSEKDFIPCHALYACDLNGHQINKWDLFLYEARVFCRSQGPSSAAFLCDKVDMGDFGSQDKLLNGDRFIVRYRKAMLDKSECGIDHSNLSLRMGSFGSSSSEIRNIFIERVEYHSKQSKSSRITYINANEHSYEEFTEQWVRLEVTMAEIDKYLTDREIALSRQRINATELNRRSLIKALQEGDHLKPFAQRNYGDDPLREKTSKDGLK